MLVRLLSASQDKGQHVSKVVESVIRQSRNMLVRLLRAWQHKGEHVRKVVESVKRQGTTC